MGKLGDTITSFDGDGRRVKSVVNNGETVLFASGYYEVLNPGSGQKVTKYYYAGASRIAMNKNSVPATMEVEYFLGDHLGSTSVTTDNRGVKVSEMRYKPWGEVRFHWVSSTLSTTPSYKLPVYTFTGQRSYMDDPSTTGVEGFGLLDYNARMYDPAIGRFVSADTIVPGGVQGLDRYAYVNNSPVRYIDPSGHEPGVCDGSNRDPECDSNYVDPWKPPTTPTTIVILVCGVGTGEKCESGWEPYGNEQPLSDYTGWATANGYGSEYFGFGEGDTIEDIQARIEQFMKDHPGANFILIGHSAGADAVWNAALSQAEKGNASRIHGVLLLDAGAMEISREDINKKINSLTEYGINVASFSSVEYQNENATSDVITLPDITQPTTIQTHYALAVDNVVLEQTLPILNGWVSGY